MVNMASDGRAIHSTICQEDFCSDFTKAKSLVPSQRTSGVENNVSTSTKDCIRRKLTARVIPMTRKTDTSKSGERNLLITIQKNLSGISNVAYGLPSCTNTSTTSLIKTPRGSDAVRSRYRKRKHELPAVIAKKIKAENTPSEKQSCLKSEECRSAQNVRGQVSDVPANVPTSPDSLLPSQNLATMSLLSASQCHLATLQDEDGDTPLHIAIAQCNVPLVRYLITLMSCLTLDIYNNLKQAPLHLAVITNQPEVVRSLVCAGADVNIPDRNGQTPAHLAAQRASIECLMELSRKTSLNLDLRNYEGLMPLHVAVIATNNDVIKCLVSRGANIDCKDGKSGRTPLHYAIESESLGIIRTLMNLGANVSASSFSGCTPLALANGRGSQDVIKLLLGAEDDYDPPRPSGPNKIPLANYTPKQEI